ncbi:MAG: hypothetical protein LBU26_03355, partial [Synergistaceae bacterium]|nr:hypothetical protein [Synergistaceae bacterium]
MDVLKKYSQTYFKLRFAVIFGIGIMAMFYGTLVFAGEIIPYKEVLSTLCNLLIFFSISLIGIIANANMALACHPKKEAGLEKF